MLFRSDISSRLASQIARVMQALRDLPFHKVPGVAETLDWGLALMSLHSDHLDVATVQRTRGCILKAREDWVLLDKHLPQLESVWNETIVDRHDKLETDFGIGQVTIRR